MEGGSQFFAAIKAHIEHVALPQLAAYQALPLASPWHHCVLCGFPTKEACPDCDNALCTQAWCIKEECAKCKKRYCRHLPLECGECSFVGCTSFACDTCDVNACEGCRAGEWYRLCAKHTKMHDVQLVEEFGETIQGCRRCRIIMQAGSKRGEHCDECKQPCGSIACDAANCTHRTCKHHNMLGRCVYGSGDVHDVPACHDHVGRHFTCKKHGKRLRTEKE
jgi:hypothetical protein